MANTDADVQAGFERAMERTEARNQRDADRAAARAVVQELQREPGARVTRRTAFRGQRVDVFDARTGEQVGTGAVLGFGSSVVRVSDNGKFAEFAACTVTVRAAAAAADRRPQPLKPADDWTVERQADKDAARNRTR